ncbi:unnamed protein product [Protopolystoma xenopodis]|uniref:Uncharacterized protein n=1 Tax=Protopolystoma xenopodis TaxID=117903 RepID=A0A3S5A863_9PLAT|nr:unnamed protein product [Protopolystoma xenopodis]
MFLSVVDNFEKYRDLVLAFANSGVGVGNFVAPYILNSLVEHSNWRFIPLTWACLYAQMIPLSLLCRSRNEAVGSGEASEEKGDGRNVISDSDGMGKTAIECSTCGTEANRSRWKQTSRCCLSTSTFRLVKDSFLFFSHK